MAKRHFRDGLRDLALGSGLFTVLTMGLSGAPRGFSSAAASDAVAFHGLESDGGQAVTSAASSVAGLFLDAAGAVEFDRLLTVGILGLSFSLIFAFNLALSRHLRREYASPRRGEWGRGR